MKNPARIRVHEPDRTGILVELLGEFDIGTTRALRRTLGSVVRWGQPVSVDLSGVTFLDSACLRELAVQHKLHANHLALCDPSYKVELSVAACDLEGWIDGGFLTGPLQKLNPTARTANEPQVDTNGA